MLNIRLKQLERFEAYLKSLKLTVLISNDDARFRRKEEWRKIMKIMVTLSV